MGGISQLFDFNHAGTSRKFLGHKRHDDGLEAPRNSLEFPVEASNGDHLIDEDIPYSCQVKNPSGAPMKTLINKELSSRSNHRRNAPSVVARLMGMDALPSEIKTDIDAKECRDERFRNNMPRTKRTEISSDQHITLGYTSFKQAKQELLPYSIKSTKPQPREHPQEELLQKFKKDFEAWQASKLWEHSKTLDPDSTFRHVKDYKILAQQNLNKEKLSRYADAKRNSTHGSEPRYYNPTTKPEIPTWQESGLQNEGYISKQHQLVSKDDMSLVNRVETSGSRHLPVSKPEKNLDRSFSSTRIVILRPSSDECNETDESFVGASEKLDKEGTMQDFLEEVKERLKYEIQGKATIRGIETEAYYRERSTDPKQIARHIAKQIRENVTRDLGTTLVKSESTRSYRSEIQLNGPDSPGLSRDTRRLLSDRLKNVLKNETKEGMRLRLTYDFSEMGKKVSYKEDKKAMNSSKTPPLRHDRRRHGPLNSEAASPGNLVRSFSAPVSGTAFGKLLIEDQHVLTGAHIRRKRETSEFTSEELGKTRKDGFNLKDRVSSLRHNFSLRGRLFKKKIQLEHESGAIEYDPMKDSATTPSVVMNLGTAQDNFTEVPPSPASVSSSSYDDFFKPGHPSPDSPLEVSFIEDHPSQVSGELNSKIPDPKSLLEQLEIIGPEPTPVEEEPYEDETTEVEDQPEAYARKILITAGLYQRQASNQAFLKSDTLTSPISKWVFTKVEEVYNKDENQHEEGHSQRCGDTGLSRKLLFDLMNEALSRLLGPPTTRYTFKKRALCPDPLPHGRQLLGDLMHQIRIYMDDQVDESQSLDLKGTPWPTTSYEETQVMGREIEGSILRDLIHELVLDISS